MLGKTPCSRGVGRAQGKQRTEPPARCACARAGGAYPRPGGCLQLAPPLPSFPFSRPYSSALYAWTALPREIDIFSCIFVENAPLRQAHVCGYVSLRGARAGGAGAPSPNGDAPILILFLITVALLDLRNCALENPATAVIMIALGCPLLYMCLRARDAALGDTCTPSPK